LFKELDTAFLDKGQMVYGTGRGVFGQDADGLRNWTWRFWIRDRLFKELDTAFLDKGQMVCGTGRGVFGQGTDGLRNWTWCFWKRGR
jgi:hypothetical protein